MLYFSSLSVKDFQNVLRIQRVITLMHSTGFQCNLAREQTTLYFTSCSQIRYELFLSFLYNYGFSNYTTSIGLKIWRVWVWILYQTYKLVSHVLFQNVA